MIKELDRIVNEINSTSWNKLLKMRYAYIELGKLVHKNAMFFYTIQNNLLSQNKENLEYSIDEIENIINSDNRYDYSVICKNSAEMLKYIFDRCEIDSEIRKTIDVTRYSKDNKTVDINHYFLVARDEDNNNYFMTLNPDLPNIQIGKRTSHFGNRIEYMVPKKIINDNGEEEIIESQYYEGEEIICKTLPQSELEKLDAIIGYKDTVLSDDTTHYTDDFFQMIKESYGANEDYFSYVRSQTSFYVDLVKLVNGEATLDQILDNNNPPTEEELKYSCFEFKISDKTKDECEDIKTFVLFSVIQKLYDRTEMNLTDDKLTEYINCLNDKRYEEISNMFKVEFLSDDKRKQDIQKMGMHNPLMISRKLAQFFKIFDVMNKNEFKSTEEFYKTKQLFSNLLDEISFLFVPSKYLPFKNYTSSTYLTHKIIHSFNSIFDVGYKTSFNDLELAEQVTIVKEILEVVLADLRVDESIPNYNYMKSPVKNRILSTVIFDKKTEKPFYLICVKNTTSDIAENNGYTPIIFDMKDNNLITDKSIVEIYNNYYIIKDAELKLMIEDSNSIQEDSNIIVNDIYK